MKLNISVAAALAAVLSGGVFAMDKAQMAGFEAECQKYAKEDGVAGDELEEYLAQCVQDLVASQSGDQPAESEEEKND